MYKRQQLHAAIHRTYALDKPKRVSKMALILSSGAREVYVACERIYHGFIQGYFGVEDLGVLPAAGDENKSPEKIEEPVSSTHLFGIEDYELVYLGRSRSRAAA